MAVNNATVNFVEISRAKFNALTTTDGNTFYVVREADGAKKLYQGASLLTPEGGQAGQAQIDFLQAQIDYLQAQIDESKGTPSMDWEELGNLIKSGNSTNDIKAGDKIDVNWIKKVVGATTSGATVTCNDMNAFITKLGKAENGTYLFEYNGTDWTYKEEVIDDISKWGLSVTGNIQEGELMTIITIVDSVSYDFVGYDNFSPVDNSVLHNWCLEQTYALDKKEYDASEAFFSIYEGKTLPAGKYKLTIYSYMGETNETIYFETLSDLTASATKKIQLALTENGMAPYEINDTTALADPISIEFEPSDPTLYTDLASLNVDGQDPVIFVGRYDAVVVGNNNWEYSNIRLWLNKTANVDDYVATHPLDRPASYNKEAGFLWGIDPRVLTLIQPCKIKYTAGYGNEGKIKGTTYECNDRVFLLSMKEMSFDFNPDEGNATDLYSEYCNNALTNDSVVARAKYGKAGETIAVNKRMSRSARVNQNGIFRGVYIDGSATDNDGANEPHWYAPAFIIG